MPIFMNGHHTKPASPEARGYTNAMLTLIALFLAAGLVQREGSAWSGSAAVAQVDEPPDGAGPGRTTGLVNAADQRKAIISDLKRILSRLEQIDAKLGRGLTVRVTEMPAGKGEAQ